MALDQGARDFLKRLVDTAPTLSELQIVKVRDILTGGDVTTVAEHLRHANARRWDGTTPEQRRKATEAARSARAAKHQARKEGKGGGVNG